MSPKTPDGGERSGRSRSRWVPAGLRLPVLLAALALLPLLASPDLLRFLLPYALGLPVPKCESGRVLTLRHPALRGDDVTELQLTLRHLGLYGGPVSGIYDEGTAAVVSAIRSRHGLRPSSRVDQAFWRALDAEWRSTRPEGPIVAPVAEAPPPAGEKLILIDIEQTRLTLYVDGYPYSSYPVAVGKPSTPSAVGQWKIVNKGVNVGPPFGTRWMGLSVPWGVYGVHGTWNTGSIGTAASGGCIRMFNWNVEELYDWVEIGTPVHIISPHWTAAVRPCLPEEAVGLSVVFLQWQMQRHGFSPGLADGRLGDTTADAVRDLEAFYGLRADGLADTDVLSLLDLDR